MGTVMGRRRKSNSNLPPRVYFKHGAYYHYGKNGVWTRLGKTLVEALGRYAHIQDSPDGSMPWLIDQSMPFICRGLAPNTVAQYGIVAKKLKRYFRDFTPDQVHSKHIAQVKVKMASTPNMGNRLLSVLQLIFAYAVEMQLLDTNPVIGIKRHKERKRDRLITPQEFAAIYAKAGHRMQVIMDLLLLTGQRINDVLRLKRADLLEEGIRFVQEKEGAKLIVKWTPALRATVERAKALNGNVHSFTLLRGRGGKAPDYKSVLRQWHDARKAAGVENATPHDLRAMSLTRAKQEGKDPTALAGHATAQTTVRYLRAKEEPIVSGPEY